MSNNIDDLYVYVGFSMEIVAYLENEKREKDDSTNKGW
jgi:hypothetical protein